MCSVNLTPYLRAVPSNKGPYPAGPSGCKMFGGHTVDNRNLQVTRKGPIAEADYRLVTVPASAAEEKMSKRMF